MKKIIAVAFLFAACGAHAQNVTSQYIPNGQPGQNGGGYPMQARPGQMASPMDEMRKALPRAPGAGNNHQQGVNPGMMPQGPNMNSQQRWQHGTPQHMGNPQQPQHAPPMVNNAMPDPAMMEQHRPMPPMYQQNGQGQYPAQMQQRRPMPQPQQVPPWVEQPVSQQ